ERQNLVVVAVVVLQYDVDKDIFALPLNHDRLRMQHLFVLAELLYEFFDAVFVEERFFLGRLGAFISEIDLEPGIQEGQLSEASGEPLKLKFGRNREDRR